MRRGFEFQGLMSNKISHADFNMNSNEKAPPRTSVQNNADPKASPYACKHDDDNSEDRSNNRRRFLLFLPLLLALAFTMLALGIPLGLCKCM